MAVNVETRCWILALFIRDDGERLVLGDGPYDFTEKQQHFSANAMVNDTIDVQGNDGTLISGQVRRASTQSFDGYIGDASLTKRQIETYRRQFIQFFAKNHFYSVIYVLPDGSAVKRQRGFIVDAPEVKELWQIHPEYHVALNFEDVNYYNYSEDAEGNEIYGQMVNINTSEVAKGGLVWDEYGAVNIATDATTETATGTEIELDNAAPMPLTDIRMLGQTSQSGTPTPTSPVAVQTVTGEQTVSISSGLESKSVVVNLGKNLFDGSMTGHWTPNNKCTVSVISTGLRLTNSANNNYSYAVVPLTNSRDLLGKTITLSTTATLSTSGSNVAKIAIWEVNTSTSTLVNMLGEEPAMGQGSGALTLTVDVPSSYSGSANSLAILLYNGVSTTVAANAYTDYTNVQLEKGSTATEYAPYFAPIELCKVGDAQDYLYKSNGSWYLHKVTSKRTLGSENWAYATTNTYYTTAISDYATSDNTPYSSHFAGASNVASAGATPDDSIAFLGSNSTIRLYIKSSSIGDSASAVTTWMANNKPTIYYALATPTDTEITNEEVVAGLDSLLATQLHEGGNVITTETVYLQPELSIVYTTAGENPGGFEWEEGGGSSIITVDNNSIDTVYPILTITGPTANPELDNLTTGQFLQYAGTVAEGQTLVINMVEQTAKLNGTNVLSRLSGNWMTLVPGTNRLTYTADNSDAPNATMEWAEVVG